MHLKDIQLRAHANAVNKGFWDEPWNFGEKIALIHSEASEALEAHRKFGDSLREEWEAQVGEELADIIIRVCDLAEAYILDLETQVEEKMKKNEKRPRKHGKAY